MNRISQYWPKTAVNITQALAHTHSNPNPYIIRRLSRDNWNIGKSK